MEKSFSAFLRACRCAPNRDEQIRQEYERLKGFPVVRLEADCGLSPDGAAVAKELLLVCGAYLSAETERERTPLRTAIAALAEHVAAL